jgi:tetrahydromethanopterin S-methyltransferase subunit H
MGRTGPLLLTFVENIMALDQGTLDAVNNSNFKTIAEASAVGLAQAMAIQAQNAASHQNRVNVLAESALAAALKNQTELDPTEAASIRKVDNADLAKVLAELGSAVAGIQQLMKGAQTTLPETGR